MYGAPPVCLNQSPGHPVQCAAIASQPAQSEGQGRGAPGSVSASHVLAATPFPKPWCLNVLLCGGGGVLPSNGHSTVSAMWLRGTGSSGPTSHPDH